MDVVECAGLADCMSRHVCVYVWFLCAVCGVCVSVFPLIYSFRFGKINFFFLPRSNPKVVCVVVLGALLSVCVSVFLRLITLFVFGKINFLLLPPSNPKILESDESDESDGFFKTFFK